MSASLTLSFSLSVWLALKVALIAGGGSPEENEQSHFTHIHSLKVALEAMGVSPADITIFWADGLDEGLDRRLPPPAPDPLEWTTAHTPWQLWFERAPALTDTRWDHKAVHPAKREPLRAWLRGASAPLKAGDTLLLAVTDHGRPDPKGGWRTAVELWGETLGVEALYEDLKVVPPGVRVQLWMSQCFSGGFAQLSMLDPRVCGAFSAEAQRPAYGCFTALRGAGDEGDEGAKGHFMQLLKAFKRTGRLDLASDAAMEHDDTPDTPHLSSDAFVQRLTRERAEALGVPVAYLVDTAIPSPKRLTPEQRRWAQRISRLTHRFAIGSVHSFGRAHETLEEVQSLRYTLEAWLAKWSQLSQEAKLRLLSESPVDGAPPEPIADRRRGRVRLTRWLKDALRAGAEGRRGLLKELQQKLERAEALMDRLYTLEALALRLETLYTRLAAEGLLAPPDLALWQGLRECERAQLLKPLGGAAPEGELPDSLSAPVGAPHLSELRAEVEALRPGSLGVQFRERARGKLAEVVEVGYGSPGWALDVRPGDAISWVDGRRLSYSGQLREQIALYPIGEDLPLKRRRDGQERLLHLPVVGAQLSPAPPKRGDQVPPLSLEPIFEGEALDYLFTGGRPSLLFFWATWCEPCLKAAPRVHAWAKRHDLQVLAITSEDARLVRAVLGATQLPFPALHDPGREASRLFHVDLQVTQAPVFVYLDVERRLIEQGIGMGKEGPAQIEALLVDPPK